jgi:hypothetical protein
MTRRDDGLPLNRPEHRWKDTRGRWQVNLDPTTGLCVGCLSNPSVRRELRSGRWTQDRAAAFDARAAAARNDE